jgi:hypothetical protein
VPRPAGAVASAADRDRCFTEIAAGRPTEFLTWARLAESNAEDAATSATCDQTETIRLLDRNAASAAIVRALDADQLARAGPDVEGIPEFTVDRRIRQILIGHITTYLANIRSALGLEAETV